MEKIRKQFKQYVKLETVSGSTSIVPDLEKFYNFNVLLVNNNKDFGIFTSTDIDDSDVDLGIINNQITGETRSRLYEIQKASGNYFTSVSINVNGLDNTLSTETRKVYYIDGAEYIDDLIENKTYITLLSDGLHDTNNFNSKFYYMEDSLIGKSERPRIKKDVFIDRQEISISEGHYRLTDITTIADFSYYGGGKFFNIKEN